ncbi:Katanin p60 ATPase-containing subunit A-like 2 [Eumeta japonica]|uniref:Katanin p60 ATPase-containing subunit A-like 2 n=1 Tax=Eumeta variegata TaxID=151549 RepID=A0A4C1TYK5_EUMVA|nr:Katanin p60 ATPase-containing subunit A-like 2 [Eumeta japonica]
MAAVNRPMSRMRKLESKEALFRARKRILKYLVLAFLKQEGYLNAAETFANEASLTDEYEICDNIDLDIILQGSLENRFYSRTSCHGRRRSALSCGSFARIVNVRQHCNRIGIKSGARTEIERRNYTGIYGRQSDRSTPMTVDSERIHSMSPRAEPQAKRALIRVLNHIQTRQTPKGERNGP